MYSHLRLLTDIPSFLAYIIFFPLLYSNLFDVWKLKLLPNPLIKTKTFFSFFHLQSIWSIALFSCGADDLYDWCPHEFSVLTSSSILVLVDWSELWTWLAPLTSYSRLSASGIHFSTAAPLLCRLSVCMEVQEMYRARALKDGPVTAKCV